MTGRDERLARQWAQETLDNSAPIPSEMATQAAARHIMATTTPTMADIEWVDSEHTLAGATVMLDWGPTEVVMLSERDYEFIDFALPDGRVGTKSKDRLTPNGKRYGIHEIGEHPETLRTAEDYKDAPVGTIVANSGRFPLIKRELNVWANMFGDTFSNGYLADTSLKVLRWGWGE